MTSLARAERAALLDLMTDLGPDAPTLCEGWTTHDLAAHLVVRERRPLAAPGLAVPALHGITAAAERRMRGTAYDVLLERLRQGPLPWSPVGAPDALYDTGNLHEFFVHHEDVRRLVDPAPRSLDRTMDDALWRRVGLLGRQFTRRTGVGLTVVTPDARATRLRSGEPTVVVRGTVGEVFLWLWGRPVAQVELEGADEAVAKVRSARIGP